jgi:N-methylhydantoinase B
MEIGVRSDTAWVLSAMYDRHSFPAQGMLGGSSASPGAVRIADGEVLRPKGQQRIPASERILLDLPGGGGFEDAREREPERVARDVTDGLVSMERAREVYNVALTRDRHGYCVVDEDETIRLRAARQASSHGRD